MRERLLVLALAALTGLLAVAAVAVVATGGFVWDEGGVPVRMTNVRRTLTYAVLVRCRGVRRVAPAAGERSAGRRRI